MSHLSFFDWIVIGCLFKLVDSFSKRITPFIISKLPFFKKGDGRK